MSLANILTPNNYDIYVNSLTLSEGSDPLSIYNSENLTLIMTYEDGTTGSYNCKIERIGNVVHFYLPYNSHTNAGISTANRFFAAGQIPAIYRPTTGSSSGDTTVQYGPVLAQQVTVGPPPVTTYQYGFFDIKSNGAFDLFFNLNQTFPDGTATLSFYKTVCTWYIA